MDIDLLGFFNIHDLDISKLRRWPKKGPCVMGNDFSPVPPSLGSMNELQRIESADLLSRHIARVGPLPAAEMWK